MSNSFAVLVFLVMTWGFGYSLTYFISDNRHILEKIIMRIGIGLGCISIFAALLNLIHLPIDWKILLFLSMIMPAYSCYKNKWFNKIKEFKPRFKLTKKQTHYLILFFLFFLTLFMYHKGAFSYWWLEDGDSWHHTMSVKYVAAEKKAFIPEGSFFYYLDAYPPGYASTMGVMYQITHDMIWTLKFFNLFIISLGILFFYFFASELFGKNKALFATAVLVAIPSYLSHFIWAHTLVITLIFPFFYCAESIKHDKKWKYVAGAVLAAILLVQPSQAFKIFVLFLIYAFIKIVYDKKRFTTLLTVLLVGLCIALILWWGPMMIKYGGPLGVLNVGLKQEGLGTEGVIGVLGSATRLYTFDDFFTAKKTNMINQPIGWGIFISILILAGIVYFILGAKKIFLNKEYENYTIVLLWFIFAVLGLFGGTVFPIALHSFRFWVLAAIAGSLIASIGFFFINSMTKKIKIPTLILLIVVVLGLFFTSFIQKYTVNTVEWMTGPSHYKYGQMDAYKWLGTLPKESKILLYCQRKKFNEGNAIAFDLNACPWCKEVIDFTKTRFKDGDYATTPDQLYNFLTKNKYEYVMLELGCMDAFKKYLVREEGWEKGDNLDNYAANKTLTFINQFSNFTRLQPVHSTQGSVTFKVI